LILLAAVVADASQRHDLVAGRAQLGEPQARDQVREAEGLQKARHELVFHRLVGLDTAVDPAVCDHFPAVHLWLDRFHADNWAAVRSGTFPNLRRDGIHPSPGYVLLPASAIPDREVTGLGGLGHLPVIYGATGSDPVFQFFNVVRVLIHLKYVNLIMVRSKCQICALRDAIIPGMPTSF
jgi:hypothetical protein